MTSRASRTVRRGIALVVLLSIVACTSAPPTAPPQPATESPSSSAEVPPSPSPSPSPTATAAATRPPSPSASPSATAAHAPASPGEMHVYRAVVPMAFPFAPDVDYRYVPNFYENRGGRARDYNHIKRVLADGTQQRAHDGVDIFVARGTPVRAVFDGVIMDPAVRWRPWNPARYGTTAVVISTEPTSPGYAALYMHLDRIDVAPGDRVRRGEVIGTAGSSGNATGSPLHLHFEMRSPFRFEVRQAGLRRQIDAFDPYPSLVAADPKAADD